MKKFRTSRPRHHIPSESKCEGHESLCESCLYMSVCDSPPIFQSLSVFEKGGAGCGYTAALYLCTGRVVGIHSERIHTCF